MQVSNPNNVKIYNLSAGKSMPEWLSDRKKRNLQKHDLDIRRRIDLVQDFEMPTVSNCIKVSKDKQYIFCTGVYKPRVKCYDVSQLCLKFERCMDSEIVQFHILSEDYTKLLFLQCDRYVEIHSQHGRYYRTRIPKYGRDLSYHEPSCDMYFVGASREVYRLNLEQGRFLNPLKTDSVESYCCQFNPVHHLFSCGTIEGNVECWDPRTRNRVGKLDCANCRLLQESELEGLPSITSLKYKDGLQFAVGTSTGQVLLYDVRSDKPLLMKDHQYGLPIVDIAFCPEQDLVISCDTRIVKLWDIHDGKAFTAIEPGPELNSLCLVPETGMLFLANEAPKVLTYYIPSLGPAPKWSAFLDSLTEELEENPAPTVYDDYKFVTRTELESLGLAHLVGSGLLRAYMHGYFMDIRLYQKAKSLTDPFAYEEYRKSKIKAKIEEDRTNRVKVKKLPKVNRLLAEKIMEQTEPTSTLKKGKQKGLANLLKDQRFSRMFSDADFQVDAESEEYRLLNPLVSKLDKSKLKKQKQQEARREEDFKEIAEDADAHLSSDEDSSDDEHTWTQEMKKQHRMMRHEAMVKERQRTEDFPSRKPKFFELKQDANLKSIADKTESKKKKLLQLSLADRLEKEKDTGVVHQSGSSIGNMEMTFRLNKGASEAKHRQQSVEHHAERRKIRRSAGVITKNRKKDPTKFWMGKQVRS